MKDLRKIAVWTAPVAILIVLVLVLTGCSNPDEKGPFGFNIASNSKVKAVFTDPIFRQIGFDSNDPYSKYLTEGVGLEYHDQRYIIELMENTVSTMEIASTMVNNADIASILVGLATRGVQIRVVTEKSNFDFIDPTLPATTRQVQQQLIDAGVQIRTDNDDANRLMHERYMIIDNTYLLVGSADFLCTSFSETINNVIIIESIMSIDNITTARAADVNTVMDAFVFDFEQMFNRGKFGVGKEQLYKNTFEDTGTKIEVYFGPTNNILEQIVDELNNVDDIMFYSIQQFTNNIMAANMRIMKSNFTVQGVIDSSSNLTEESYADVGAIKFDGQGYNTLNHKYIVIDFPLDLWDYEYPSPGNLNDPVVVTGSANWNESNFTRNDESMIVVHDLAMAYRFGLVEFQSNVMGAQRIGIIWGECRSAVNNVPLECTVEIRVERKGFLPGLPDPDDPVEIDSDPKNGFYSTTVPGGLTDVTVTEVPDAYLLPDYILGNQLIFPGGSQRIFWYLPLQPAGSGYGGGGGPP
ncbi:hypothetical protein J7L05_01700 [bacterium]|nr:hypothetical protein [bacterium]